MISHPDDFDSTLIRRGNDAATFREMADYAHMLEERPLAKLLMELPALAHLSSAKFDLTAAVLRRRFRLESETDREQLTVLAHEIAAECDTDTGDRIRAIFG